MFNLELRSATSLFHTHLIGSRLCANSFVNTFHSFNVFIIYLLPASKMPYGNTEFTFTVQRESANALKLDAIDLSETEHTGNVSMENNRRLEQTAHNQVANKILMSLDLTLLSLKH